MRDTYRSATDTELLRASADDPEAFEVLFERHAEPLRAWLARRVGDVAIANDLLAETFAQAWCSRRRFGGEHPAAGAAWIYGIARNLLRQHYKRGRVDTAARRRLGMRLDIPRDDDLDAILERADAEALSAELGAALAVLPTPQRRAVEGRILRDQSYSEIAAGNGCSSDNARARVSRGLRTLQRILTGVHP